MPAVVLNRLREQLRLVFQHFDQPPEFTRLMVELCEEYHDPSFRSDQAISASPFVASLRLPNLVIRQLEISLVNAAAEQPAQALPIADSLWALPWLETRRFAALLLGQIPLSQAEGILARLTHWAQSAEDRHVLDIVLTTGTARLRREGQDALLELYAAWLYTPEIPRRLLGLRGYQTLVDDPGYINLPPVFSALSQLIRSIPPALFNELNSLLILLAFRAPVETAFFLRQVLATPVGRDTPRLIRRLFPYFTSEQQAQLRSQMKS